MYIYVSLPKPGIQKDVNMYIPSNAWFIHKFEHLPPILLVMAFSWFLSSRMWVSNFTTWRWWIVGDSFCLGRITILGSYLDSFFASSQKALVGKIGCNKRWQPTCSGDVSLKFHGRFWEWGQVIRIQVLCFNYCAFSRSFLSEIRKSSALAYMFLKHSGKSEHINWNTHLVWVYFPRMMVVLHCQQSVRKLQSWPG